MAGRGKAFWWGTAVAVVGGWLLAFGVCLFSILVVLPERDLEALEIAGWGLVIVVTTLASIIAALSLLRLAHRRRSEWFSTRVQLGALTIVGLVQLRLVVFLVVEPFMAYGRRFEAIPSALLLLGAFQLAGLSAAVRAIRGTAADC